MHQLLDHFEEAHVVVLGGDGSPVYPSLNDNSPVTPAFAHDRDALPVAQMQTKAMSEAANSGKYEAARAWAEIANAYVKIVQATVDRALLHSETESRLAVWNGEQPQ